MYRLWACSNYCYGGSDPREGWSLSRADPGGILTSAVGAKGPHPWRTLPEDGGRPNEAVWCAEHDLVAVILFLSLRMAFQAEDVPHSPPYLLSPPALLSTVLRVVQNCIKKRKPENRLSASKSTCNGRCAAHDLAAMVHRQRNQHGQRNTM